MEINVNLENKEQAMDLLTQITDKFGITKSNLSEAYNSRKIQGGGLRVKIKI